MGLCITVKYGVDKIKIGDDIFITIKRGNGTNQAIVITDAPKDVKIEFLKGERKKIEETDEDTRGNS